MDRVRWADVDVVGIMRYSAYPRLFEAAELDLFRAAGVPYALLAERFALWLPRKVMSVEYHAPARLDEELAIATSVSRIGTTALTMRFEVSSGDRTTRLATGELVMVCVGRADFVKQPLPRAVVEALAPFTVATG
jgi:YbgC/YbaW family acyl-CoA thioester hydrolase